MHRPGNTEEYLLAFGENIAQCRAHKKCSLKGPMYMLMLQAHRENQVDPAYSHVIVEESPQVLHSNSQKLVTLAKALNLSVLG